MNETEGEIEDGGHCDFCGNAEEHTNRLRPINDDLWFICETCMFMMHRTKLEDEEE